MLTSHISTVDQRAKRNGGFVAGPNHRMLNNATPQAAPEPAAAPAPGYKEGEPGHQCMECEYYQDDRTCTKHNFTTKPQMVCDDFEPKTEGDAAPAEPEETDEQGSY
jgi:hypothetical protein